MTVAGPHNPLHSRLETGSLDPLDWHFARFILDLAGTTDESLFLAAALVSRHTRQGHVCLDLRSLAGKALPTIHQRLDARICPELAAWRTSLAASRVVGVPGERCPLILDEHSRLYLFRYWEYERDIAAFIREYAVAAPGDIDLALLERGLERYFRATPASRAEPDWQKVAARTALTRTFAVITGGPGTGKTTTVAKVLALLREQPQGERLRIALAAPTGKAAARLEEAIRNACATLEFPSAVQTVIPTEASTLHRLLGALPNSPYFRHDASNPLAVDLVIVDEASMVDLALMAKLVRALPPHTRLILLGDKDQLASVEAGAVMGDICDRGLGIDRITAAQVSCEESSDQSLAAASTVGLDAELGFSEKTGHSESDTHKQEEDGLQGCIVELRESFRFLEGSGIGRLSRCIRAGDGPGVVTALADSTFEDLAWQPVPPLADLADALRPMVVRGFAEYLQATSVARKFAAFERFRIICALRRGPYGAEQINGLVERILLEERLIPPGQWYFGRPVMITQNDYNLKLYNGDVGIVLSEDFPLTVPEPTAAARLESEAAFGRGGAAAEGPVDGWHSIGKGSPPASSEQRLRVFFPTTAGTPRMFLPARLPPHETVYAMTVHKSQGSEFDEVLLLLPDRDSPVLTRELLYTGITRARQKVTLWGHRQVLLATVSRPVERSSGLRDALWGASTAHTVISPA